MTDLAKQLGRMEVETEDALWELVAAGLVTGDGIAGLRTLLLPDEKRRSAGRPRHLRAVAGIGKRRLMPVGRWALLHEQSDDRPDAATTVQTEAARLLNRYGIVFRDVITRERKRFPWRVLLHELRRREACGEVRGGRFVDGFVGEQFALPQAVETLRALRNRKTKPGDDETVILGAGDPLNLVGILVPGQRISPFSKDVVAYRGGLAIETGELGRVRSRLQGDPLARG